MNNVTPLNRKARAAVWMLIEEVGLDPSDYAWGSDLSVQTQTAGPDAVTMTIRLDSFEPRTGDVHVNGDVTFEENRFKRGDE